MKQRALAFLVFGVAVALGVAGCGGGGGGSNPNTTISVVIYPGTASIPVNGVINFTAVVYNFTSNSSVDWTSSGGSFTGSVFTAPSATGNVTVTATSQEDKSKSATVTVMIGAAQPVTVSPGAVSIPAQGTQAFTASGTGPFHWTLTASLGADPGTIDQSGNYTAPRTPPPGGTVTVSALSAAGSGTATVTIVFSAATLSGQYTFSYTGEDAGGFLAVAGTFTVNGSGLITSGVEDVNSASGITENPITGGNFAVGPDGRAIATVTTGLGSITWQVTLISEQHALLVRFDSTATGSGTIDKANPADFSVSAIANNYSFGISGIDSSGSPMAIAGRFFSDGAGTFPVNFAIQDVNDAGTVSQADLSLHGDILSLDGGTGRGTLELISTVPGTGTLTFAFYIIDNTHFKLVEIDNGGTPVLAGDAFSAPKNSITLANLTGNYAFTVAGAETGGPYAAGGVFTASGTGTISGGVQDVNEQASTLHLAEQISSSGSTYTLSPTTTSNRILLTLSAGGINFMYAVYPTAANSFEMVEVDSVVPVSSGMGFLQSSTSAPSGTYGINTTGQTTTGEQDINGSISSAGTTGLTGYLDINETGTIFSNIPLFNSTIAAPSSFGRATLTLATAKPTSASFTFAYYVVDNSTVLVIEMDKVAVTLGVMDKQF